ncbi:uncharacterized protein [Nicotiana tomentosiformis]|uniref:uncharacterized protein n=1 Tax=Nicotiana tomentosiformis TaxID=4098 RepID=UPI00388CAA32
MTKTSKTVPQKEAASSCRSAGEKPVVGLRPEELILGGVFLDAVVACMLGAIPHLKNWVRSLVSTSTYAERVWHDLSKGRWEARTHGLGKDATMRPPPGDEDVSPPISKPAKENKRKRALNSEGQKPKKRTDRKSKGNTIPLTMELVQRLREEEEEEEEEEKEDDCGMVARARASTEVRRSSELVGVDTAPSRLDEVEEETSAQVPEPRETKDVLSLGEETVEEAVNAGAETGLEAPQDGGGPKRPTWGFCASSRGFLLIPRGAKPVQRKLDVIGRLREEVDAVKAEAEAWTKNIDRLASEKEVARAQLASAETQLQSLKEKALVQTKKIEEFQYRLGSATSDREKLATELAAAKLEVEMATTNADAMVAVYRFDSKAAQARANWVAEHAKCHSRRETLEEIHARGFDLTAEIENAKELEAEARVLAFPNDDDSGSMSGSESGEGLESEDVVPGED